MQERLLEINPAWAEHVCRMGDATLADHEMPATPDGDAAVRVEGRVGEVLPRLVERLGGGSSGSR